jgi:hypothetical protein
VTKWFEYTRYKSTEERLWLATFWVGILLFILWCEVVIGIAVARLFLDR